MSQFLYDLIQSLTRSEKVHFKRYAKVHGGKSDKNYLKIYEALDKLKKYDSAVLSKHFEGSTIEKYRNSEVKYLVEKILLSLTNFNFNKSRRNQIQKKIMMLDVLAEKGFKKEALKKLNALKKSAIKHEEFTALFRLIEMEESTLFRDKIIGYKEKLKELREQRSQLNSIIDNLNSYHILRQEVHEFQFNDDILKSDFSVLNEFCEKPLVNEIEHCLSKRAQDHWYYINVLASYLKFDFKTGLQVSISYVNFMTENSKLFDIDQFLPALSNYIYHAALTQNKEHFEKGEAILIELAQRKSISESYVKYIRYTRNIEFAQFTNDHTLMRQYLTLTTELIAQEDEYFDNTQTQYMYLAIVRASIILKEYRLGMLHCNLWNQLGVLPYQKVQAKLLSIILHYEVGYMRLIESEIISLKKLVKSNLNDKRLIDCFYTFFSALLKHPERKKILVSSFQQELEVMYSNPTSGFTLINFNFYRWSLEMDI